MAQHRAGVTIAAPIHQVYALFSRFSDYPKFMSYVKEVTSVDERTTEWVVDIAGRHAWTAVNEDWIPDRQIGWRSTVGFRNSGRVVFAQLEPRRTSVELTIDYEPPVGPLGGVGEVLGIGATFERALQHDLDRLAAAIEAAPSGALDLNSAEYVFNPDPTDAVIEERDPQAPVVPGTSRDNPL